MTWVTGTLKTWTARW